MRVHSLMPLILVSLLVAASTACASDDGGKGSTAYVDPDAGTTDVGTTDSGADTGTTDTGATDTGATDTGRPDARPGKGTSIGTFWNTYYYLADESGYDGADDTTLYDASCQSIAEVPADFAGEACIEGSARLEDGTVINYDEPCSCGPCSFCWAAMDPATHPWGMGSRGNALELLRSWAVDTAVISYGTLLYVEAFDGVQIPQVGELGGYVHDGCFRADDVGGGIDGNHFDLFAGTPEMWQALEAIHPTRTEFTVYVDSPRCTGLTAGR